MRIDSYEYVPTKKVRTKRKEVYMPMVMIAVNIRNAEPDLAIASRKSE